MACENLGATTLGVLAVRGCLVARRFGKGVTRGWLWPDQEATVAATDLDQKMPVWDDQCVTARVYIESKSELPAEEKSPRAFQLITRFTGLKDFYAAE